MRTIQALLATFATLYVPTMGGGVAHPKKDEFLKRATEVKHAVEVRRTAYQSARNELFSVVDQALQRIPDAPTDFAAERAAISAFHDLIRRLREEGDRVRAAQSKFLDAAQSYQAELPRAVAVFERISSQFAKYAAEQPYDDHREDYACAAAIFKRLAERSSATITELRPEVVSVSANVPYMERSLLFLTRLDEALQTIPEFKGGDEYDSLVFELKKYIAGYERMRSSLREFHDQMSPTQKSEPSASNVAQQPSMLARQFKAFLPKRAGSNPAIHWTLPLSADPRGDYTVTLNNERVGTLLVTTLSDVDSELCFATYVGTPLTTEDVPALRLQIQ